MMSYANNTKLIVLYQTTGQIILRQISMICTIISMWSLGYFADSPALQWAGVLVGIVSALAIAKSHIDKHERMTPEEARAWLDENFPSGRGRQ